MYRFLRAASSSSSSFLSSSFMPSRTKTGSSRRRRRRLSPDSPPSLFGHVSVCWAHAGTPHKHLCVAHSRGRLGDELGCSALQKKRHSFFPFFIRRLCKTQLILFALTEQTAALYGPLFMDVPCLYLRDPRLCSSISELTSLVQHLF